MGGKMKQPFYTIETTASDVPLESMIFRSHSSEQKDPDKLNELLKQGWYIIESNLVCFEFLGYIEYILEREIKEIKSTEDNK